MQNDDDVMNRLANLNHTTSYVFKKLLNCKKWTYSNYFKNMTNIINCGRLNDEGTLIPCRDVCAISRGLGLVCHQYDTRCYIVDSQNKLDKLLQYII